MQLEPAQSALAARDPWEELKRFTDARIALGRVGVSLPTSEVLRFGLAHAQAQTAVHSALDADRLASELRDHEVIVVASAAQDREIYLKRPDLGRQLGEDSRQRLREAAISAGHDALFVLGDGLSPLALHKNAAPFLSAMWPLLQGWRIAPLVIASQSRVALGDEIGEIMRAEIVAILIGERPGLSSPDSMGVYLTYAPRPGRTDAERNCISNIRPAGLSYAVAACKLHGLMTEARRLKLSGVRLKEPPIASLE